MRMVCVEGMRGDPKLTTQNEHTATKIDHMSKGVA